MRGIYDEVITSRYLVGPNDDGFYDDEVITSRYLVGTNNGGFLRRSDHQSLPGWDQQ
jgi:hypothetical protein